MGGERRDAVPPLSLTAGGWWRLSGDARPVAASTTDLVGNAMLDTTHFDLHYSQYDKNGDVERAAHEPDALCAKTYSWAVRYSFYGAITRPSRARRRSIPG